MASKFYFQFGRFGKGKELLFCRKSNPDFPVKPTVQSQYLLSCSGFCSTCKQPINDWSLVITFLKPLSHSSLSHIATLDAGRLLLLSKLWSLQPGFLLIFLNLGLIIIQNNMLLFSVHIFCFIQRYFINLFQKNRIHYWRTWQAVFSRLTTLHVHSFC